MGGGGGLQNYPDDYAVINELHRKGELTVRFAYNLFTQHPKGELADFQNWAKITRPGEGDEFYRMNGAGEMLVYSAADFEDFFQSRPDMQPIMESELKAVIRHLVENRWPFRLHATYNETISRALAVFEEVNREIPFNGLHWFFDHCETISDQSLDRVKALDAIEALIGDGFAVIEEPVQPVEGDLAIHLLKDSQGARNCLVVRGVQPERPAVLDQVPDHRLQLTFHNWLHIRPRLEEIFEVGCRINEHLAGAVHAIKLIALSWSGDLRPVLKVSKLALWVLREEVVGKANREFAFAMQFVDDGIVVGIIL